MYRYIILLILFSFSTNIVAQTIVPVKDKKHRKFSKVMKKVQTVSLAINARVTAYVGTIKDIQEVTAKALQVVNGVVKNVRMVKEIIRIKKDINELVLKSISVITSDDGYDLVDKWKYVQVLLTIADQAESIFDLFKNVVEDDTTIMDDDGRLTIIKEVYIDARKIKIQVKSQMRRINKEVYKIRTWEREIELFESLFKQ